MSSPWIAGLGSGLSALGSDLQQREVMRQAKARQDQQDALNALILAQKVGARILQPGEDPSSILQGVTQRNDAISGLIPGGTQGAIPLEASGTPPETVPNQFGRPSVMRLPNGQSMLMDPSQTPEALQERRASLADLAKDRRAREQQQAAQAKQDAEDKARQSLEDQKSKERAAAATRAAQGDYVTLQALDPKHPLSKAPFNADYAASYAREVAALNARNLQASAYHAPPAEWIETPSIGPHGRVIIMNKVTGARKEAEEGVPKPPAGTSNQGAQTSLPDLLRTHDALTNDENDPQFKVNRAAESTEGGAYGISHAFKLGQAPSIGTLLSAAGGNLMGGANDRQMNYFKNGRSWGEDASNAWKGRTNEQRVVRDITTGTLDASTTDNPLVRSSLQQRRENVIAMTAIANPAQFAALPPEQQRRIQGMISQLPPDKLAAAQQAAAQAPSGPTSSTTATPDINDVDAYLKHLRSKKP